MSCKTYTSARDLRPTNSVCMKIGSTHKTEMFQITVDDDDDADADDDDD